MGFDIVGPSRRVSASTIEGGPEPRYDILSLPKLFGLSCPQLERLHDRFYDDTTLRFSYKEVHHLRDEIVRVQKAYRARREPELILERGVRSRNHAVRAEIVERVLLEDPICRALEEVRLLCDEAIAARADVRCQGD